MSIDLRLPSEIAGEGPIINPEDWRRDKPALIEELTRPLASGWTGATYPTADYYDPVYFLKSKHERNRDFMREWEAYLEWRYQGKTRSQMFKRWPWMYERVAAMIEGWWRPEGKKLIPINDLYRLFVVRMGETTALDELDPDGWCCPPPPVGDKAEVRLRKMRVLRHESGRPYTDQELLDILFWASWPKRKNDGKWVVKQLKPKQAETARNRVMSRFARFREVEAMESLDKIKNFVISEADGDIELAMEYMGFVLDKIHDKKEEDERELGVG